MDDEMAAMMGFGGFGKKAPPKKSTVTEANLERTKRDRPASSSTQQEGSSGANVGPLSASSSSTPRPEAAASTSSNSARQSPPTSSVAGSSSRAGVAEQSFPRPRQYEDDNPSEDDDDDDDDAGDGGDDEADWLPASHEIGWKDHGKPVSALALDGAGARLTTGSHDYDVKMYDFGGMTAGQGKEGYKPFRSWEPAGSYHIHNIAYSPDGEQMLIVSGTSQAQVFSRDGEPGDNRGTQYMKGDPYIRDMKHTSGHVAELNSGCWNPKNRAEFITCSNDSTVRIWDVEHKRKQKTVVVVKSKERGTRTRVTTCAFAPDGKNFAAAGYDGTIHMWSTSSNYARPNATCEAAHAKGTETSGLAFSIDGRTLASRGGDDTVKLWDMRNLRKPVAVQEHLGNFYPETNIIFSPDDKHILTGLSQKPVPTAEKPPGQIACFSKTTLEEERRVSVGEQSIIRLEWHARINQLAVGSSSGLISVLYSPRSSLNGALLPLAKLPKTAAPHIDSIADTNLPPVIITPHALPMFREENRLGAAAGKRKRERERNDPVKTMKPKEPLSGPGHGGRVGASATQHLLRDVIKDNTRTEDPREALLKYADAAETNPIWAGSWANQPKVFRNIEDEPEEDPRLKNAPKPKGLDRK